ncbi:MAG: major capsid protein [Phycisphaerae bacterium]
MATAEYGSAADMVYKDTLRAEEYRRTIEKIDIFNEASRGAIVLESDPARQMALGGDFTDTARWKPIDSLVSSRNNDSPGDAVNIRKLEMTGGKLVSQTKGCGPVAVTDIQARKAGRAFDMNAAMVNLGQQFADSKILAIRNNIIAAAVAAVDSADTTDGTTASANIHVLDVARGKMAGEKVTASMAHMNLLLARMGDAREEILTFVMPSAVFADLVGDAIANYKFERVAGVAIYRDVVQAFGRTVLVVDAPSLINTQTSGYFTDYVVLGLGGGSLTARVIYDQGIEIQRDILKESSVTYVREDFDVQYEVYGMKWASATDNPTDAELATAANWDEDYQDHRQLKVVKGIFNATV